VRGEAPESELVRSGDIERVATSVGAVENLEDVENAVGDHGAECVFHLAAQTLVGVAQESPFATFETNVKGTYTVLEACRLQAGVVTSVVVASSDKVYGVQELPYVEDMPLLGQSPYAVSKACADMIARTYAETYGMNIAVARFCNIYGGGDLNWANLVPGTIRSLLQSEAPVIRSDGSARREYLYVADAVSAYLSLAEAAARPDVAGAAFNFGPERTLSVLEVVVLLREILGRTDIEPQVLGAATGEVDEQRLSVERTHTVLGWGPAYTAEDGFRETVDWYRRHLGS
jgi:CDP-glucose 4,6-dehydratase